MEQENYSVVDDINKIGDDINKSSKLNKSYKKNNLPKNLDEIRKIIKNIKSLKIWKTYIALVLGIFFIPVIFGIVIIIHNAIIIAYKYKKKFEYLNEIDKLMDE